MQLRRFLKSHHIFRHAHYFCFKGSLEVFKYTIFTTLLLWYKRLARVCYCLFFFLFVVCLEFQIIRFVMSTFMPIYSSSIFPSSDSPPLPTFSLTTETVDGVLLGTSPMASDDWRSAIAAALLLGEGVKMEIVMWVTKMEY